MLSMTMVMTRLTTRLTRSCNDYDLSGQCWCLWWRKQWRWWWQEWQQGSLTRSCGERTTPHRSHFTPNILHRSQLFSPQIFCRDHDYFLKYFAQITNISPNILHRSQIFSKTFCTDHKYFVYLFLALEWSFFSVSSRINLIKIVLIKIIPNTVQLLFVSWCWN